MKISRIFNERSRIILQLVFVAGVLVALLLFSGCARNNRDIVANGNSELRDTPVTGQDKRADHTTDPVIAIVNKSDETAKQQK